MSSVTYWFPSNTNMSLYRGALERLDIEFREDHALGELTVFDPIDEVRELAQDLGGVVRDEKP